MVALQTSHFDRERVQSVECIMIKSFRTTHAGKQSIERHDLVRSMRPTKLHRTAHFSHAYPSAAAGTDEATIGGAEG